MKEKDLREVLDIVASDRDRTLAQEWPKQLEWFMCPDCKCQTLAMKFIPKSNFSIRSIEFGKINYDFTEMNYMTMVGRQCIICKKKFIPYTSPMPKDAYIEGE
jgi:hypothetical protein